MKAIFSLMMLAYLFSSAVFAAADTPAISFSRYYQAACHDYTGTWQGFITDPTDLFANGGPWPVTVYLYEQKGKIVGKSSVIANKKERILPAKSIWADCEQGVLKQIIWGEKGECGGISDQGMLVGGNMLLLHLAWENAMKGATFYVFLKRVNNHYPFAIPTTKNAFSFGKRESCH